MTEIDISPPPTIPFQEVLDALLDADTPLPPRYLYRLSDLGPDEVSELRAIWKDIPTWRRKALLEDLEQLFGDDYLLSFESVCRLGLNDSNSEVRFLSIHSLFEYDVRDLIPELLDLMVNDNHEDVRAVSATVLGKYVYEGEIDKISQETLQQIEDQLLAVVQGNDTMLVRRRALESLGFSSRAEVPALIETAYIQSEYDWVVSSVYAMGRSCDEHWEEPVIKMLNHVLPAIRTEAARAAGEIEISDTTERLIELLEDDNADVRMASAWSLSQIGGEGVQEALSIVLENTEETEEAEFIESAIDNLIFNQGADLYGIIDFPKEEDGYGAGSDFDDNEYAVDNNDEEFVD